MAQYQSNRMVQIHFEHHLFTITKIVFTSSSLLFQSKEKKIKVNTMNYYVVYGRLESLCCLAIFTERYMIIASQTE